MTKITPRNGAGLAATLALAIAGCSCQSGLLCVDGCADVPSGAIPEEAGVKIHAWQTQQISTAAADLLTLYVSDFVGDSAELSPAAEERIGRIVHSQSAQNLPWVVEPSGSPALDQARVNALVRSVANRGVSPIDVSVATPPALGLAAPFAERISAGGGLNRNAASNNSQRTTGGFTGGNSIGGAFGGRR